MDAIRPRVQLFTAEQVEGIIGDALRALETVGFFVENDQALELLRGAGVRLEGQRAFAGEEPVRAALATAPRRFTVFDREGKPALELGGDAVQFDPGSAALWFLDPATGRRKPGTADLTHLAWVTEACTHIAGQSTGLVPADVPEAMGDRWRLYVALLGSRKPVITGTFRKDAFAVMRAMLAAVRGGEAALAERPLGIFDCCPTPPLKWSDLTCQALIDCARSGVPAELVSMPLAGATSPVTLREMVVQHCAESLSGVLVHQLARPGAPIVFGGSPSAFDMRHGTTPMGAVETMMVDVGYAQVGKHLGLPTHAYMGLADAKGVDYQSGLESGLGAVLAALAGINVVSGPGMLDFESCQSLEKLVVDNEICGMTKRLVRGIEPKEDFPARPIFEELMREKHLLIAKHTRKHLRSEIGFPGPVIDRANQARWLAEGGLTLGERARREVGRLLEAYQPSRLPIDVTRELVRLMQAEATRAGMDALPERTA